MSEKIYEVPAEWKKRAYLDDAKYREMYARSIKDPNGFWAEHAKRLDWIKAPTKIKRSEERRVGKECRSRWSPYH